jgi:transposase
LKAQILQFDRLIMAWHRSNQASRRLDDIPGVGPILATALVATDDGKLTLRVASGGLDAGRPRPLCPQSRSTQRR